LSATGKTFTPRLIGYIRDALQPQLAEDLVARMEEKVYVEDESETALAKAQRPRCRKSNSLEPPEDGRSRQQRRLSTNRCFSSRCGDPIRQRSVLIYDSIGHRIVTAIEILSPWNKSPGKAVNEYLHKRDQYINSEMNLVEIDLDSRRRLDRHDRAVPSFPREG